MITNGFGSAGGYPRSSSALSMYLRRIWKALRLRGPLADDPTAQILHALLVGLACAMILEFAFLPVNTTKTLVASLVVSFIVLCIVAPLVLLRRGSLRSASLTFLSGSGLLFTFVIILNGGIRSVGAVYYLVLPISAAWLLGYRAALVSAGICLGSLLIMAVLDVSGHPMPRYIPGNPLGLWASVVEAMIMAAVPIARILQIYKEALARLRESEERFRNMADTAPVMIWVAGVDKLSTFFNKPWLTFTGRTMEQELRNGWASSLHPDDLDRCLAVYSSSFDARHNFEMEYRLRREDGAYRWILDRGTPLFVGTGTFQGYIGSCLDITDFKLAQEALLTRQKLASVGVLAAGISHDFNNLLGGILAEAELAEVDLPIDSSPLEEIQRIKASAIRGAEIVRELMIYAGQDEDSPIEPVDLSRLVAEMLELLKLSISKHAVLTTNLQKNLPTVWGNAAKIRQVVMNLVINASEAIGERDGVISVTTEHISGERKLALNGATDLPESDYVRLEVSDTGCGMTEETRTKIFDPFFSTKFAGRGLGLAVVQGNVHDQGGTIDLMSTPGLGTTFQVFLSCAAKASNARNAITSVGAGQSQSNARTGTVLVAEDEEVLRRALTKALIQSGFSVMEASDGSAAMELIRAHLYDIDVVLLDVTLPGMTSREVFQEIQRIRPDLKVILTSAYSKQTVDAAFAGLRIEHFIRKPFQLGDLVNVLQGVVLR